MLNPNDPIKCAQCQSLCDNLRALFIHKEECDHAVYCKICRSNLSNIPVVQALLDPPKKIKKVKAIKESHTALNPMDGGAVQKPTWHPEEGIPEQWFKDGMPKTYSDDSATFYYKWTAPINAKTYGKDYLKDAPIIKDDGTKSIIPPPVEVPLNVGQGTKVKKTKYDVSNAINKYFVITHDHNDVVLSQQIKQTLKTISPFRFGKFLVNQCGLTKGKRAGPNKTQRCFFGIKFI